MATFETRTVTKPFHLPLEDYQKLFGKVKPRKNYVGIVLLEPIENLSGIFLNQKKDQQARFKMNEGLMKRGQMVIFVGPDAKDLIKPGDLLGTTNPAASIFATSKKVLVSDVFPRVRSYTYIIVPEYELTLEIDCDVDELEEIEIESNITIEEKDYLKYQAELEEKEEDANLFKD